MLKLTLIACGNKMPLWVNEACKEFSKRLNEYVNLKMVEIPLATRHKSSDMVRLMEKESALILQAIPAGSYVISLAIFGKAYLSEELANHLQKLQQTTSHLCFIIGGPEGLTEQIIRKAHESWSLSKLTFPHPIVRVLVLESLYRAFSIIHNHPYHK